MYLQWHPLLCLGHPCSISMWSNGSFLTRVFVYRIAKEVTGERFGPNEKKKRDMVGSFIRHGLTKRETEETV